MVKRRCHALYGIHTVVDVEQPMLDSKCHKMIKTFIPLSLVVLAAKRKSAYIKYREARKKAWETGKYTYSEKSRFKWLEAYTNYREALSEHLTGSL